MKKPFLNNIFSKKRGILPALFAGLIAFSTANPLSAQDDGDVFRYSSLGYKSTARSLGAGNAMGALGGDYGALVINPAGLAVYRASEFTISGGLSRANTDAILRGGNNAKLNELDSRGTLNNLGLVISNDMNKGKWQKGNFAVGINRLADFNRTIFYSGTSGGSVGTVYAEELNRGINDQFTNGLASDEEVGLVLFDNAKKEYFSDFENNLNVPLRRSQILSRSGGVNELNISYAANYDNKLMIGATIGVPFARFNSRSVYTEEDVNNLGKEFISFTHEDELITSGTGINLKLGAIYRPSQAIRLGLAVHTPTAYSIAESREANMTFRYFNSNPSVNREEEGTAQLLSETPNNYTITTPWRIIGSAALVVGKFGFLSADIEHINYASGRLRFDVDEFANDNERLAFKNAESAVNSDVSAFYTSALNFRLGGEVALDIFRLRGGINLLGSGFVDDDTFQKVYTFGLGLRGKYVFGDLAYRLSEVQEFTVSPYSVPSGFSQQRPVADVTNRPSSWVLTVGFRF